MLQQFNHLISDLHQWLISGVVGAFGALGHLLFQYSKGNSTSIIKLLVTLAIGFFVGNLVGSFLPVDLKYRDGILMVAGFGCYPILDILEQKITMIFKEFFDLKTKM